MNIVEKFLKRTFTEKLLLLQIIILLPFFQGAIKTVPFHYLRNLCGLRQDNQPPPIIHPSEQSKVREVAWAIVTVERYLPNLPGRCLARALTARRLLKRRNIPCRLYLGANRESNDTMTAHAWLTCENMVITGAGTKAQYKAIASFS